RAPRGGPPPRSRYYRRARRPASFHGERWRTHAAGRAPRPLARRRLVRLLALHVALDPDTFRAVLGRFASGVTVVTTRDDAGRDLGMTVSAFCSLSLEPPLVVVCIAREASMHDVMRKADTFAVNILSSEQEPLSRRFSTLDENARFDGIGYSRGRLG